MGYDTPADPNLGWIKKRLETLDRIVGELAAPSSGQIARTLDLLTRIDNLANRDRTDDFAITTTPTVRASETYTAPDYPTKGTFTAIGVASGRNQSASLDHLLARVEVIQSVGAAGQSTTAIQTAPVGHYVTISPAYSADILLDPGETVEFQLVVYTSNGTWPVDGFNEAQITYQMTLEPII